MPTALFTGYPGFLGSALLPRVLHRDPELTAACLVQEQFRPLAERRLAELVAETPAYEGRVRLVTGDITEPDLGLGAEGAALREDTVEVWHLAAVYDLAVGRDFAVKVNVDGTRHVLDYCGDCPQLRRLHYVSTCYVSGRHPGIFRESDLVLGQTFNNFYEETKYLAEVLVQERMAAGLPTTIYRPGVVVGDAATGETQKYDGPYFIIRWLLKQPGRYAVLPVLGRTREIRFNVVPRDFVLDAIEALSATKESEGRVYALAAPQAPTIEQMLDSIAEACDKRLIRIPSTRTLAKGLLARVPGAERLTGIPAVSIDYFEHPTYYATDATSAALEPTGVVCPPFSAYVDKLVAFVRAHPEFGSKAMV